MRKFDRYLGLTVLLATGAVLLVFLSLLSIFALIEELGEGKAAYTPAEALVYVALTLPRRCYELLPYSVFLGGLIGLGHLASRWELVALRAAGVSSHRLFAGAVWAVFCVALAGAGVAEWVAPEAESRAEARKSRLLRDDQTIAMTRWYREGPLYVRVDALAADGGLIGVSQYRLDESGALERIREAARAEFVVDDANQYWRLQDVRETRLAQTAVEVEQQAQARWFGAIDPRLLSERELVDPRRLSIGNLVYRIGYLGREGFDTAGYRLAFWSRCLQPLAMFALVLLALSFVLGPLREVGMGVRISAGIVVGLCFKYLQDLFAPMSLVYGLEPPIAVALPILACWIVGYWGVRRAN